MGSPVTAYVSVYLRHGTFARWEDKYVGNTSTCVSHTRAYHALPLFPRDLLWPGLDHFPTSVRAFLQLPAWFSLASHGCEEEQQTDIVVPTFTTTAMVGPQTSMYSWRRRRWREGKKQAGAHSPPLSHLCVCSTPTGDAGMAGSAVVIPTLYTHALLPSSLFRMGKSIRVYLQRI